MSKKQLHKIPRENWKNLRSMILNTDEYEEPFDMHSLLFVSQQNDNDSDYTSLVLKLNFTQPTLSHTAKNFNEIYDKLLTEIRNIASDSYELSLGIEDSMIPDRAPIIINMAANTIAQETRRGVGNILLASKELYEHLFNLAAAKKEVDSVYGEEFLFLNGYIRAYSPENFKKFFPECEGILMYWGSPNDGPISIRYHETERGVEYDILTLDEAIKEPEYPNVISESRKYFVKLVK